MTDDRIHWTEGSFKNTQFKVGFDFIACLEDLMQAQGVDQSELAERVGITRTSVVRVFHDPSKLSLKNILEFTAALGHKVAFVPYYNRDQYTGPILPQVFLQCWERQGCPTSLDIPEPVTAHVQETSGMPREASAFSSTPVELERQRRYDELVAYFGVEDASTAWRQSPVAFALHQRIVRILDGLEPDPRTPVTPAA